MRLEFLLEWSAAFATPLNVGKGPQGERIVAHIRGGSFAGPRLRGNVLESGADWALIRPDGNLRLDVRLLFETDDAALIYVSYRATMLVDDALRAVLFEERGGTEYGQSRWFSQLDFETGDPRYVWLNDVVAVGEGKLAPNRVSYRVYTLEPG